MFRAHRSQVPRHDAAEKLASPKCSSSMTRRHSTSSSQYATYMTCIGSVMEIKAYIADMWHPQHGAGAPHVAVHDCIDESCPSELPMGLSQTQLSAVGIPSCLVTRATFAMMLVVKDDIVRGEKSICHYWHNAQRDESKAGNQLEVWPTMAFRESMLHCNWSCGVLFSIALCFSMWRVRTASP